MENIKLTKIKIKEYKSIYETELDINDRIIVIAGKNESGKTNILKALRDGIQDKFDDDCKPLGLDRTNPTLEMEFEFAGEYLNKIYSKKIFKNKEIYTLNIIRSMNVIDKVSGSLIEEIKEYINKEIAKIVENNSEIINDFSNLKSDIYFEGVDGKQYVIEYITFYFVNQLFYNGDKEDLPFVADLQSKIEEDADGNQIEFENIEKLVKIIEEKFKEQKEFIDDINNKNIFSDFVYFSSFDDMLPDEIDYLELEKEEYRKNNKGFINLLNYLNISVEEFVKRMNEDVRNVQNYLRNLSTKMTGNFSDIYTQETIELSLQKDGSKIVINIFDKNDKDYSKKPSQRSQGFQWFLAFYLVLNSKKCKDNTILLIDEPGLFLHAKAQEDILNYFETKIHNQIIYTTHSPFLIDVNNMHRVRLAINNRDDNNGTKIINKYYAVSDFDTITPLITAIGYNIAKNPLEFGHGLNIITEGITDRYYLLSFMKLLNIEDTNIHIIPSKGVSQIHYLVSIALGWGIDFKILMDNDKAAKDAKKELKKTILQYEENELIVSVSDQSNSTIETLFENNDIDLNNLKENKTLIAFDFYQKVLNDEIKREDLSKETIDNFEKLFKKLGIE
ncbi:MAG: AAA family ATPase [Bdellovibrionota bacterium]|nr:AAA family ATPase [Bdellovibrionota bacterium]